MDVVYAAERHSIAKLLADYVKQDICPDEIELVENPAQTGSFYIGWRLRRYVLSPAGEIQDRRDGATSDKWLYGSASIGSARE